MRKKTIVAIFAHPDDEAFGPGGTLATLSKQHDVYLICVTNGDSKNGKRTEEIKLGKIRKSELLASSHILGLKKVFFLGYRDGSLNNNQYHAIEADIKKILDALKPSMLLTFEPRGVSGHTDHIVVSNVSSFVFKKSDYIKTIWYYCLEEHDRSGIRYDYFIYFPPGYKKSEIGHISDVADIWDTKVKAMHCHQSQKHDIDKLLSKERNMPKKEYFLVKEK